MSARFHAGPGRLNRRLVLEASSTAAGGDTVWTEVAALRAGIEPAGLDERAEAGHVDGVATHRIVLRRRDGLSSRCRFRLGARLFRVLAVHDPDERGRYLVCLAEEAGR